LALDGVRQLHKEKRGPNATRWFHWVSNVNRLEAGALGAPERSRGFSRG